MDLNENDTWTASTAHRCCCEWPTVKSEATMIESALSDYRQHLHMCVYLCVCLPVCVCVSRQVPAADSVSDSVACHRTAPGQLQGAGCGLSHCVSGQMVQTTDGRRAHTVEGETHTHTHTHTHTDPTEPITALNRNSPLNCLLGICVYP